MYGNLIELCNEGMESIVLLRTVCQFCIVALDVGHYHALALIAKTIQIRDHKNLKKNLKHINNIICINMFPTENLIMLDSKREMKHNWCVCLFVFVCLCLHACLSL